MSGGQANRLTTGKDRAVKNGQVTGIYAIEITCECGEACINANASQMILPTDKTVKCEYCGNVYAVPANAFCVPEKKINRRRQLADLNKKLLAEM